MTGLTKLDEPTKLVKRLLNLAGLANRPKPPVGQTPSDVIHRENKWRLIRYRPRAEGVAYARPVLLVPSLINRHYVLDLMPGKSFAEWMVARGHDVYVVDWGTPGKEDRHLSFDAICDGYLGRAVRAVSRRAGGEDVHLLGYCLGGTLTTIYAAAHPEGIASLVDIAAPIAFDDDDDGLLARWTRSPKFDIDAILDAFGNVPWPLMQAAFHMLRPTLSLSKGVYLLDRAWDDEFLDGFFALETWGNDNVSFPGAAFKKYVEELYRKNSLVRGEFTLSGERVDLARIACPLLDVTFEHDNIVSSRSAAALIDLVSSEDKELFQMPGGHVGAVVSKGASRGLWPKLSEFWASRDGDAGIAHASMPAVAPKEPPRATEPRARPSRRPRFRST
jgi:polyhydroxyalkanoate synthase